MRSRELTAVEILVNVKFLWTIDAAQSLEALGRQTRGPSYELQKGRPKIAVEALQHFEKPNNHVVMLVIVSQLGILLEILDVNGRQA